jgi:hypothetical protein
MTCGRCRRGALRAAWRSSNWCAMRWPAPRARAGAKLSCATPALPTGRWVSAPWRSRCRTGRKQAGTSRCWPGAMTRLSAAMRAFVTWRGTWSHIIEARACAAADPLELPSAIWSPGWVMHRLDPERCNGYSGAEPERRLALRESLQRMAGQEQPGLPCYHIGAVAVAPRQAHAVRVCKACMLRAYNLRLNSARARVLAVQSKQPTRVAVTISGNCSNKLTQGNLK